ncbi:MAG: PDZ domain-containing protein, partial [Chloroflexi bacterium]|nr:PDZ domain-containing protein [Chloroflexota bacterium]
MATEKVALHSGICACDRVKERSCRGSRHAPSRQTTGVLSMTRSHRLILGLAVFMLGGGLPAAEPDLSEYRTVDKAITTRAASPASAPSARPGFLGVHLAAAEGGLAVAEVAQDSPAAKAGVRRGDLVLRLDGKVVKDEDACHDLLRAKSPGESIALGLSREGKPLDLTATLVPLSRPMTPGRQRGVLGIQVEPIKDGEGVTIESVTPRSAAERAKLKVGEVILKIDGTAVTSLDKMGELLADKRPDDTVTLTLLLAEKAVDLKVTLGAEDRGGRPRGWGGRGMTAWSRPVYRLGIICVEYPDAKHNPKIPAKAWEEAMFSRGKYTKTSPTGQTVYGSLYDYYFEQS